MIRIGGNSQGSAVLVQTSDGRVLEKDLFSTSNPIRFSTLSYYKPSHQCFLVQTQTPCLVYTSELLWMPQNISSLVNVRWHLGIPFNDTSNFQLASKAKLSWAIISSDFK